MQYIGIAAAAIAAALMFPPWRALSAEKPRTNEADGSGPPNTIMKATGGRTATETIPYKFNYTFWWKGADTPTNAGNMRATFGDRDSSADGPNFNGLSSTATTLTVSNDYPFRDTTTARDRIFETDQGRGFFIDIMRAASWGLTDTERAAFIVELNDGSLHCLLWPARHSYDGESFHGTIPSGTLAIIHTHPINRGKFPSGADHVEATRLGIPIYVLTLRDIYIALPKTSRRSPVVRDQLWLKRPAPEQHTTHCRTMR
jgi:hypothetical protein